MDDFERDPLFADAEILQKATGRSLVIPALERAETRKVALRDELLESWADQVIAATGDSKAGAEDEATVDARTAARAEIDAAFESLFESDGAIDMRLHKRVIPVMQDQAGLEHEEDDLPLTDTFLPLFHQLAVDQGARDPLEARVQEVVDTLSRVGRGYLDPLNVTPFGHSAPYLVAHLVAHRGQPAITRPAAQRAILTQRCRLRVNCCSVALLLYSQIARTGCQACFQRLHDPHAGRSDKHGDRPMPCAMQ